MLIRLACDAYKAVSCICFPLLSIGVGLCFVGELDGELSLCVGVGVEGSRDDVEHAWFAIAVEGEEVLNLNTALPSDKHLHIAIEIIVVVAVE